MQDYLVLAKLRIKNHYTQPEIAEFLNVGLSTYKLFETGILPMNLEQIDMLSNIYHVSFDYLLGFSKNPNVETICDNIDYSYLKFSIRYLRKRARLSQKSLAKEFNISISSIIRYEKDSHSIHLNYLILLVQKFQISADYICGKTLKKEIL